MYLEYNRTPEIDVAIRNALPSTTLTESILIPQLLKVCKKPLLTALRAEIEIYKSHPKSTGKKDKYTFDPTNHKTCFMGQGFKVDNSGVNDAYLKEYRKAVGTLHHGVWGNATLLEIWAADHFDSHRQMVKGVFSYCLGDRHTLPALNFYVLPLFQNKDSGKYTLDDDDRLKAMESYLVEYNGMRVEYKLKPVDKLDGDALKEFNKEWERRKAGLEI